MPNPEVSFPARYTPVTAVAFVKADGSTEVVSATTPLPVQSGALLPGTSHIGNVFVDDVADGLALTGSAISAATVVTGAMAGFGGGTFQVTSSGSSCTITYEQSNDGVIWLVLPVISAAAATGSPVTTSSGAGLFAFASSAAQVRARVSTYGSGTVSVVLVLKRRPLNVSGTSLAGGSAAIGTVNVTGTVNTGVGYTDSVAALAGTASFTGIGRANSLSHYGHFVATAFADVAGTVFIEQSLDAGATYQPIASAAVAAGGAQQLVVNLTGSYASSNLYRVRYVNGAAAQATFRLSSAFATR